MRAPIPDPYLSPRSSPRLRPRVPSPPGGEELGADAVKAAKKKKKKKGCYRSALIGVHAPRLRAIGSSVWVAKGNQAS